VRNSPGFISASRRSIVTNDASNSRYSAASGLHATASSTDEASAGFEAACSPGLSTTSVPGWFTARTFHDRDHRAAQAGGHRENGALHGGDRNRGQDAQVAPPLFRGLDDDVAPLEVNRRPLQAAVTNSSVRSLTSTNDPSARRNTA